jgi:hypothetical protein
MGLLNRLFGSRESIAKEINEDNDAIIKHWKNYLDTVSVRKEIIKKLSLDTISQSNIDELRRLLDLELIDISNEEKEESELIADLDVIENSQKIKRVHKLEQCLDYAETKYEYVYELLSQLHPVLQSQIIILTQINLESKNIETMISNLKSQFELELEILVKIEKIESFHNLFLALINGEHVIKKMDSEEKLLLAKLKNGISKIFSNELTNGITYTWAINVFNAIQDVVMDHEAIIALGYYPHSDIDFEFVNSSKFVDLVKENIPDSRKKDVSDQIINVFVHLFREWYNHERD